MLEEGNTLFFYMVLAVLSIDLLSKRSHLDIGIQDPKQSTKLIIQHLPQGPGLILDYLSSFHMLQIKPLKSISAAFLSQSFLSQRDNFTLFPFS